MRSTFVKLIERNLPYNIILSIFNKYILGYHPHWARVVGYGPFSICVIHTEVSVCAPVVGTLIG
jgi:hypothetical protein